MLVNQVLFVENFLPQESSVGTEQSVLAQEYIYPIAQLDDDYLLVMYQKSYDDIELWRWNRHNKRAFRELASIFLPSYVRLLPSKTAFSFIDHGRVRIKSFQKRAPRVIDIHETVHAISSLKWITDEEFYFVGKDHDNFSVLLCDVSDRGATLFSLHDQDLLDYLYPCKINQSLFCLTRDNLSHYSLCKLAWNPQPYNHSTVKYDKEVLLAHDKPLCFLHMEDECNGFALEYNNQSTDNDFFYLSCCALTSQDHKVWSLCKLFEFKLPLRLLTGIDQARVYESIDPFLPCYSSQWIYFVTYDELTQHCNVHRYNRKFHNIEKIETDQTINAFNHVFAPLVVDDYVYFGFAYNSRSIQAALQIDSMTGMITCCLPEIVT